MKQNTKRLYSMIFALVFIVGALVIYFDFLVPAYADLQAAKGNQMSEQNLLNNEKQIVQQFQTLLASYQNDANDIEPINTALPVGPHLADAVAQIYGAASANSVSVSNMSITSQLTTPPAAAADVNGVASTGQIIKPIDTLSFSVGLSGSFENFQNFLTMIQTNLRIFDVKQVALQPGTPAGTKGAIADFFNYTVMLQTYYQPQ